MCTGLEPVAAASAAASPAIIASLGGAAINYMIQRQAIERQNRENRKAMDLERAARDAEIARQRGWEAEQVAEVNTALAQVDPGARTQQIAEAAPDTEIARAGEVYNLPYLQGQTVSGTPTSESIGSTVAEAVQRAKDLLNAQSTLSLQTHSPFGASSVQDGLIRMAGNIRNVNSDRMGSMNASRMETRVPVAQVTPSNSPIGDVLLLLGRGGAGYLGRQAGMAAPFGDTFDQRIA